MYLHLCCFSESTVAKSTDELMRAKESLSESLHQLNAKNKELNERTFVLRFTAKYVPQAKFAQMMAFLFPLLQNHSDPGLDLRVQTLTCSTLCLHVASVRGECLCSSQVSSCREKFPQRRKKNSRNLRAFITNTWA